MGDFNVDLLQDKNKTWPNLFTSYGLSQIIDQPTRVATSSTTVLDHILVSNEHYVQEKCVSSMSISDHYPNGVCWRKKNKPKMKQHREILYHSMSSWLP